MADNTVNHALTRFRVRERHAENIRASESVKHTVIKVEQSIPQTANTRLDSATFDIAHFCAILFEAQFRPVEAGHQPGTLGIYGVIHNTSLVEFLN